MLSHEKIKIIARNITYLISGNFLSLFLGFAFNVYIAKTLGIANYGIFSTVDAFTAMFGFFVFEGYQKVAIRECCGDKNKLQQVIENILGIRTLLSLLAVSITMISSFFFDYSHVLILYIAIYSFNLLFGSITSMLHVVFHVNSNMKYIAYSNLLQRLIYIIPAGICIWFDKDVKYLILFFTLSTLCEIFLNLFLIKKFFSLSFSLRRCFSPFIVNRNYFKEAFVFSLLGFIGYFHGVIDITMLSWMMPIESVGLYAAANKLIMPLHLIGRMIKVAFFPQFLKAFKAKQTVPVKSLFKISGAITFCMLPIAIMISIFSEQIILLTFGEEFFGSAEILKVLCWIIPFGILALPFTVSMQANHHEKKLIIPNILRSLSNVALNYIFIIKYGIMGAVYSTVITYFWYHILINFGYQYYILKKSGNIV